MTVIRNLILVGGVYHPFEETGPALAGILNGIGWYSEVSFDIEAGLEALSKGAFDQLTFTALRWTMTQNEKYAPFREQWALSLSDGGKAAIRNYIAAGKGLLGIHAAPISFDDWLQWGDLLGLSWQWGTSYHPPHAPASVRMSPAKHPVSDGVPAFEVSDEIYSDLVVRPWMKPLFEARHADMTEWRTVGLAGEKDGARRAWCGLGHDAASLANPAHQKLIRRAAQWVSRAPVTA